MKSRSGLKTELVAFKVTKADLKALKAAAKNKGQFVSVFSRAAIFSKIGRKVK